MCAWMPKQLKEKKNGLRFQKLLKDDFRVIPMMTDSWRFMILDWLLSTFCLCEDLHMTLSLL